MDTILIDRLAQEIRRVDGSNSLGAAALAKALMPFVAALQAEPEGDVQAQARAWIAITELLNEVDPDWVCSGKVGMLAAVDSIRKAFASPTHPAAALQVGEVS